MGAFFPQPVSGTCCDEPCTRYSPCDPCEDCPTSICCDDNRGSSPDYSGTYTRNGSYGGTPAYEKNGGGAWFWRDWDGFPDEGWWVVSTPRGDWSDGVTQSETVPGGDECPQDDTAGGGKWELPLDSGSVVSGACP